MVAARRTCMSFERSISSLEQALGFPEKKSGKFSKHTDCLFVIRLYNSTVPQIRKSTTRRSVRQLRRWSNERFALNCLLCFPRSTNSHDLRNLERNLPDSVWRKGTRCAESVASLAYRGTLPHLPPEKCCPLSGIAVLTLGALLLSPVL
jgi:hypothetical protein